MFHYIQLALLSVATPVATMYVACAAPCLAFLRAIGVSPRPASADEDLSGRVIIVTGANTGKWLRLPIAACSRLTHRIVCKRLWCLLLKVVLSIHDLSVRSAECFERETRGDPSFVPRMIVGTHMFSAARVCRSFPSPCTWSMYPGIAHVGASYDRN